MPFAARCCRPTQTLPRLRRPKALMPLLPLPKAPLLLPPKEPLLLLPKIPTLLELVTATCTSELMFMTRMLPFLPKLVLPGT